MVSVGKLKAGQARYYLDQAEPRHEGSGLAFEVSDDGHGFGDEINVGRGLANMEDRVNAVGGRLSITSLPLRGTSVQGWVGETPARPSGLE
jgi:signal transduction histidine kinase